MGKKISLLDQVETPTVESIKRRFPRICEEIFAEGYQAGRLDAERGMKGFLAAAAAIERQASLAADQARATRRNAAKLAGALAGRYEPLPSCGDDQGLARAVVDFAKVCISPAPDGSRVPARQVYEAFRRWWESTAGEDPPSWKRFGVEFGKHFQREKRSIVFYLGLRLTAQGRAYQASKAA